MPAPSDMFLYVFQNDRGLIKVGRALDPEHRRATLERQLSCKIRLIAALPNCGQDEERLHSRLARHRVYSEWFSGCDTCRSILVRALGIEVRRWPYRWNRERAYAWVKQRRLAAIPARIHRERLRLIGRLRGLEQGMFGPWSRDQSTMADFWIEWELHHRLARCLNPSHRAAVGTAPPYTGDVATALSLLPEEADAPPTSDSPLAIAIAALGQRWRIDSTAVTPRLA